MPAPRILLENRGSGYSLSSLSSPICEWVCLGVAGKGPVGGQGPLAGNDIDTHVYTLSAQVPVHVSACRTFASGYLGNWTTCMYPECTRHDCKVKGPQITSGAKWKLIMSKVLLSAAELEHACPPRPLKYVLCRLNKTHPLALYLFWTHAFKK